MIAMLRRNRVAHQTCRLMACLRLSLAVTRPKGAHIPAKNAGTYDGIRSSAPGRGE